MKKNIVVGGFTKEQREQNLEKIKDKYSKKGYKFLEYIDNGTLKSIAIFEIDEIVLNKEKSKNKISKYFKEGLIFIVVLSIALNAMSYYKSLDLNKDSLKIESFKLLDNSEYKIPRNKPLLIHFWATWCPTCNLEAPNIEKISEDYEVITIAVQSGTKNEIQNYLNKGKFTFKVVNDKDGFYSRKFNIKAFPTTLIYDKDKNLKFSEVGYTTTAGLYSRMLLAN